MVKQLKDYRAIIATSIVWLCAFCLAFSSQVVSAKKLKFLHGCEEVGFRFDNGRLAFIPVQKTEENQTVFFIHNVSNTRLKIEFHKTFRTNLYPVWETTVNSDNWAAFATDRADISFTCLQEDYGDYTDEVDCGEVLQVCQYQNAVFASHNQGNYWISSNRSKYGTRNEVIRKGVLLKW